MPTTPPTDETPGTPATTPADAAQAAPPTSEKRRARQAQILGDEPAAGDAGDAAPSSGPAPSGAAASPSPGGPAPSFPPWYGAAARLRLLGLTQPAGPGGADLAEVLARRGATAEALSTMTVDELAREVFGGGDLAANGDAFAAALWAARGLIARLRRDVLGTAALDLAAKLPDLGAPADRAAELGAALRDGIVAGLRDADPASLPFAGAWALHLRDAHGAPSAALSRVLSLVLGRDVSGAGALGGKRADAHLIDLPGAARDKRRFVVPRAALAAARGDLRPHVDVARTAALVAAASRFASGFEPSPSFLIGEDRARVFTYAELDRAVVQYHPLTDAPLTAVDGRLVSAGGVDWARAFVPSPLPGAVVVDASTPRGSALLRDPMAGAVPRAAWLVLARMPEVRQAFGAALIPPELATEKSVLKALLAADVEDDLSDLQDLARAVAYYAELDPDVLRRAEAALTMPATGLAPFRSTRSTLG